MREKLKKKDAMSEHGSDLSFYSAQQNPNTLLLCDPPEDVEEDSPQNDGARKMSLFADATGDRDHDGEDSDRDSRCGSGSCVPGSTKPSSDIVDVPNISRLLRRATSSFLIPLTDQTGSCGNIITGLLSLTVVGSLLGLVMPKNPALPTPLYRMISSIVGYVYFICWSVSFYPQVRT